MGHVHLATLPRTKSWEEVVDLLEHSAPEDDVIAAAAIAAERDFVRAAGEPIFVETVRLLLTIPQAAREKEFALALRRLGMNCSGQPDLLDLVMALGERLDAVAADYRGRTSDFGELARRALLSTITAQIGADLPGLFQATPEDVRAALRRYSHPSTIPVLARAYFGELLSQNLRSWLDRVLSTQVGRGRRFADVGERSAFDVALSQYCDEATRMIREFSEGWYALRLRKGEEIGTTQAAAYGAVAMKKITEELRRKRDGYA